MLKTAEKYIDVEAYFALEETSEQRSEYYDGDVFSMAGGTPNHNRIIVSFSGLLNAQFRDGRCEAFVSDLRVQIEKNRHYTYPDVAVVCGELKLADGRSDTIVNPAVIVEVLSETTKDYDRGTKFTAYRGIRTLTDYILVDQKPAHIEYFSKESDNTWRLREYFSTEDILDIKTVRAVIPVQAIYERVTLDPA